ncbi:MAG: hypothetical protein WA317_01445 [Mycobacterium sp.]|uniref:hypothetical protein n=1 Tax=Mycobacterium sp. TaxID=1785 RepID=UPI003CC5F4E9
MIGEESTRWVVEVLEETAGRVREQGLVDFNVVRSAEVEEYGPVEANGALWRNRRPTGRQTITMRLTVESHECREASCGERRHYLDEMVTEAGEHHLYADTAVPRPTR